ncbi:hypothetical protein OV208_22480 [Corallococcus sp. bb12-1]|uniref:hypothetical protein n=1 Tax=Corallococcus sp. bb12-1 TaxID=2996784 RepID=UPI002270A56F|nr:hypothetical protein [Corallococcus sp. bb12-1]MCY1044101.1 hypothetical protein [Corallococcus sp. bb12-1]
MNPSQPQARHDIEIPARGGGAWRTCARTRGDRQTLSPTPSHRLQSSKEYVWGPRFGDPRKWSTTLSLGRPNISAGDIRGVIFSDFLPHRMEDVPVARIRGPLSFSLPATIAVSSVTPLSLHTRATLREARFHVMSIEEEEVSLLSENTEQPGFSAVFTDAKGNPIRASLKKREDFDDATFRLDFETRRPVRQWQRLQAQGASKTYTYPFEITAHVLKPVSSRKK